MSANIVICADADELAATAAERIVEAAAEAIAARGRFDIALSGGSTPGRLYRLLSAEPFRRRIDWPRVRIFFGDERFVPATDERSNYGSAKRELLDRVPVPSESVFAVDTALPTVQLAARRYEAVLVRELGSPPVLDLVLLGLGDDGHTASLFPDALALEAHGRWAVESAPGVLPPPVDRVTVTLGAINASRIAIFLVAGERKGPVVRDTLDASLAPHPHPSALVAPSSGEIEWILDRPAASALPLNRSNAPSG